MRCEQHPDHEADVICASCGRKVCCVCACDFMGRPHCRSCIQAGRVEGGPPLPMAVTHQPNYFDHVAQRLVTAGYQVYSTIIPGGPVLVGKKLERVFLSPVSIYVVLGNLPKLDDKTAALFCKMAYEHSVNYKNVLLSSQILTFALMSSPNIEQIVIDRVTMSGPNYYWLGIEQRIVHDQRTNMLYFHKGSYWMSGLLISYIDEFIARFLAP